MEETNQIKKHSICVYERGEVLIEGVIKLDSFDKNEFLIYHVGSACFFFLSVIHSNFLSLPKQYIDDFLHV